MLRSRSASFFIAAAVALSILGMPFAGAAGNAWKSGRVVSTGLNAHGPRGKPVVGSIRIKDMWWSYCIAAEDQIYSVLSRNNPDRTGLKENKSIQFMERQNQIFILNPAGKHIALKIYRKGKKCP
jgi:hypothetical protein